MSIQLQSFGLTLIWRYLIVIYEIKPFTAQISTPKKVFKSEALLTYQACNICTKLRPSWIVLRWDLV